MAITLSEYAKINPRTFESMVRSKIGEMTPLLSRLKFDTVSGSSYKYLKENTLGSASFRALNGTISSSEGDNTEVDVPFAHLSGLVSFDDFLNNTMKNDQLNKKVRTLSYKANDTFFNGDTGVDALSFNGLVSLVDSSQELETGVNGGALSLGLLDEAIAGTRGTDLAIMLNKALFVKFQKAARTQSVSGNVIFAPDSLGKMILTYNGIPLLMAGEDSSGAQVLDFDEDQGSSSVTSSIYVIDFAEGVMGIQSETMSQKVVETSFGQDVSFNWDVALINGETKGLTRIKGVTNLDIVA